MTVLESDRVVFVDVDNTLILWFNDTSSFSINYKLVEKLKQFHVRGQKIVVWSAGGWAWAKKAVDICELHDIVDLVLGKPSWIVDDLPASEFLPESCRIKP